MKWYGIWINDDLGGKWFRVYGRLLWGPEEVIQAEYRVLIATGFVSALPEATIEIRQFNDFGQPILQGEPECDVEISQI